MHNLGLSHTDLFGEEIEITKVSDTKWIARRKGMPVYALRQLMKFAAKEAERMNKKLERGKHAR